MSASLLSFRQWEKAWEHRLAEGHARPLYRPLFLVLRFSTQWGKLISRMTSLKHTTPQMSYREIEILIGRQRDWVYRFVLYLWGSASVRGAWLPSWSTACNSRGCPTPRCPWGVKAVFKCCCGPGTVPHTLCLITRGGQVFFHNKINIFSLQKYIPIKNWDFCMFQANSLPSNGIFFIPFVEPLVCKNAEIVCILSCTGSSLNLIWSMGI